MKKLKRILALLGVVLLAGLYLTTLILAICGNSNTMNVFIASIVATAVIPVLLWAYSMIYRLLKEHYSLRKDVRDTSEHIPNPATTSGEAESESQS